MLRLLYALATGSWLGAVLCISFVVTPAAHASFPTPDARRFLRPIFPRFHSMGLACGVAALTAVFLGRAGLERGELLRLALPVVVALAATTASRELVTPRLQGLEGHTADFERLHRVSTMLHTTTLASLLLALAAAVSR